MTSEDAQQSAMRRLAMIDLMLKYGDTLCAGKACHLLDLTIASPGIVVSLYMAALDHIENSDAPADAKRSIRGYLQQQVQLTMELILDIVRDENPKAMLTEQAIGYRTH